MRHHIHVDALLYPWPERTKTGKIRIELYGGLVVSNFIDECDPLDCTPSGEIEHKARIRRRNGRRQERCDGGGDNEAADTYNDTRYI